MMQERYEQQLRKQEALLNRKNEKTDFYNGIYDRWKYPVLTREHVPLYWRYDLNPETNPYFMERLGINAVFNAGAIELDGKICLVARVEGSDRKSFFAVAESTTGVDQFVFREKPVQLPDCDPNETNVYDMRLTKHEDGWIYGVFCSESSANDPKDLSAAVAQAGIVRTKDLNTWERLPNLITKQSPQQRNVCLLPKFVDGKYAFYTRPMDGFIDTGSGGGIGYGLVDDILHPVIETEKMTSMRKYHTITEAKNGSGATPIATEKGWLHIAHGVRNTAAGLRYVIYVFVTDLEDPSRVIAEPSGYLIAPRTILQIYQEKVFNPERNRQEVFFDLDYNSLIDLHSYGHDIESSWLIDDGCSLLGDAALNQTIFAMDDRLAEGIYQTAYRNHSVLNECENGVDDETRVWWVQAESVLGFYHMYEKHGNCQYLQAAQDIFSYIEQYFLVSDHKSEWFWAVDKDGKPMQNLDIVNGWKCPYHNGRMCLELIRRNGI